MADEFLTINEKKAFINSFLMYYKSGVPLVDSFKKMSDKAASPNIKLITNEIYNALNRGTPFDEVILRYEKYFDRVITGLLIAGEKSGKLIVVLARLQKLLKDSSRIRNEIKKTMIMPKFIFFVIVFVMCIFSFFINPRLSAEEPASIISLLIPCIIKTSIVFAGIFALFVFAKKTHFAEKKICPVLSKIPRVKNLINNANWSDFFLVMNVAYDGGLPVTSMLDLASETIKEPGLKRKLKNAIQNVMKGEDLSGALSQIKELPADYLSAIASGEATGELDKALKGIISEIDEVIDLELTYLSRMIEYAMIIISAIVVLLIILNYYKTFYNGLTDYLTFFLINISNILC
ncbi:type II secretion system F family protein [bacterium]|nr:type II secretion system F family protein [bacterium]